MTRPPRHSPDAPPGIAAIIGALLCGLLAALLRGGRVRRDVRSLDGAMASVLEATRAATEDFLSEEWVEWVAVPAPWRAGQGRFRTRFLLRARPRGAWRDAWLSARGRAPPGRNATNPG
ncbi:MAG: hypothetical protein NT133_15245 [Alphaproteobacteria bacterium]|nr:hypothetical protein [Alphaproteobacteria bacterium]